VVGFVNPFKVVARMKAFSALQSAQNGSENKKFKKSLKKKEKTKG